MGRGGEEQDPRTKLQDGSGARQRDEKGTFLNDE